MTYQRRCEHRSARLSLQQQRAAPGDPYLVASAENAGQLSAHETAIARTIPPTLR
ncbi:MAG: hypothetical protein R2856_21295 [Caldilineaceae bacterium]